MCDITKTLVVERIPAIYELYGMVDLDMNRDIYDYDFDIGIDYIFNFIDKYYDEFASYQRDEIPDEIDNWYNYYISNTDYLFFHDPDVLQLISRCDNITEEYIENHLNLYFYPYDLASNPNISIDFLYRIFKNFEFTDIDLLVAMSENPKYSVDYIMTRYYEILHSIPDYKKLHIENHNRAEILSNLASRSLDDYYYILELLDDVQYKEIKNKVLIMIRNNYYSNTIKSMNDKELLKIIQQTFDVEPKSKWVKFFGLELDYDIDLYNYEITPLIICAILLQYPEFIIKGPKNRSKTFKNFLTGHIDITEDFITELLDMYEYISITHSNDPRSNNIESKNYKKYRVYRQYIDDMNLRSDSSYNITLNIPVYESPEYYQIIADILNRCCANPNISLDFIIDHIKKIGTTTDKVYLIDICNNVHHDTDLNMFINIFNNRTIGPDMGRFYRPDSLINNYRILPELFELSTIKDKIKNLDEKDLLERSGIKWLGNDSYTTDNPWVWNIVSKNKDLSYEFMISNIDKLAPDINGSYSMTEELVEELASKKVYNPDNQNNLYLLFTNPYIDGEFVLDFIRKYSHMAKKNDYINIVNYCLGNIKRIHY